MSEFLRVAIGPLLGVFIRPTKNKRLENVRELRGTVDLSTKRFDPVKTRNESLAPVVQR